MRLDKTIHDFRDEGYEFGLKAEVILQFIQDWAKRNPELMSTALSDSSPEELAKTLLTTIPLSPDLRTHVQDNWDGMVGLVIEFLELIPCE